MKKSLLLASALALASLSATATAGENSAWFVRGEAGRSDISFDGIDAREDAFSIRAGHFFTPNLALEGFYTNYGEESDQGARVKISGFGLGVVGKKNFGPNVHQGFFISGRVGVSRTELDLRVSGVGSASDSSTNGYIGVGTGYDFNPNLGLSLNYDYTKADAFGLDVKPKTLTLGLEYRF